MRNSTKLASILSDHTARFSKEGKEWNLFIIDSKQREAVFSNNSFTTVVNDAYRFVVQHRKDAGANQFNVARLE